MDTLASAQGIAVVEKDAPGYTDSKAVTPLDATEAEQTAFHGHWLPMGKQKGERPGPQTGVGLPGTRTAAGGTSG